MPSIPKCHDATAAGDLMSVEINSWQDIQTEVLHRIQTRVWKPGNLIPNEADLAREFGCARATVNRALRAVAEAGLIDRRRKAGTRVSVNPVRKATLDIPVIRLEIEGRGQTYGYRLEDRKMAIPSADIAAAMQLKPVGKILHLQSVHLADGKPQAFEDRWINIETVPQCMQVDFEKISANEWLVANSPFTRGDIALTAEQAGPREVELLQTRTASALFVITRTTWLGERSITWVKLACAPGYRMHTTI